MGFSFSLVHVQVWATVSMWMASVSALHACKSRVFWSPYQTQMAVFPSQNFQWNPSLLCCLPHIGLSPQRTLFAYNSSSPSFYSTSGQESLSGSGSRPCSQDLPSAPCWTAACEGPGCGSTGSPQVTGSFPELVVRSKHFLVCCRYSVHFQSAEMAILFNTLSRFLAAFLSWFISLQREFSILFWITFHPN